ARRRGTGRASCGHLLPSSASPHLLRRLRPRDGLNDHELLDALDAKQLLRAAGQATVSRDSLQNFASGGTLQLRNADHGTSLAVGRGLGGSALRLAHTSSSLLLH